MRFVRASNAKMKILELKKDWRDMKCEYKEFVWMAKAAKRETYQMTILTVLLQ